MLSKKVPLPIVILIFGCTGVLAIMLLYLPKYTRPTLEGACLIEQPKDGELVVYTFPACPIGFMRSDTIYQIKSFRRGLPLPVYPSNIDGPDGMSARTGSIGTEIYDYTISDHPLISVYWDKEHDAYFVGTYSQELAQGYIDDSLTACYGYDDQFICIGVWNHDRLWPFTYIDDQYADVWVGWISKFQTKEQLLRIEEIAGN